MSGMTIQIETQAGWRNIHTAALPEGFLAGAHEEGGFMLRVTEDEQYSGWMALMHASRDSAVIGLREGAAGATFRFKVAAGATPNFVKDQVVSRDFIFESVE